MKILVTGGAGFTPHHLMINVLSLKFIAYV